MPDSATRCGAVSMRSHVPIFGCEHRCERDERRGWRRRPRARSVARAMSAASARCSRVDRWPPATHCRPTRATTPIDQMTSLTNNVQVPATRTAHPHRGLDVGRHEHHAHDGEHRPSHGGLNATMASASSSAVPNNNSTMRSRHACSGAS
jgi:hypothetical protein